jgi:hypothetical protein
MSGFLTWHWRVFNVLSRLLGLGFLLGGLGFMLWGLWLLAHQAMPFAVNGVASTGSGPKWIMTAVSGVIAVLGAVMLRVRPCRHDLGDEPFGRSPVADRRRYWTGDVVHVPEQPDA